MACRGSGESANGSDMPASVGHPSETCEMSSLKLNLSVLWTFPLLMCVVSASGATAQDAPNPRLPAANQAQRPDTVEPAALDPRAVAVMPFFNVSGDPADEWIGAGIAEIVTADLARLGLVSIAGREAVLGRSHQQGQDVGEGDETVARELGRSLGVSWVVAGGLQRVGNLLRITARVVEVETGAVSQTVKIDGGLDELFALQDRIVYKKNPLKQHIYQRTQM